MVQEGAAKQQEIIRVVIIGVFVLILLINAYSYKQNEKAKTNQLIVRQSANSSSVTYWEYAMSSDNVLREVSYTEERHLLNLGPGYKQCWIFEPIGVGMVTIEWLFYEGGDYVEEKSHSVTYCVENDTVIEK